MLWFLVVIVMRLVLKLDLGIRPTFYTISESEKKKDFYSIWIMFLMALGCSWVFKDKEKLVFKVFEVMTNIFF